MADDIVEIKHHDISPAQRSAASRLVADLNAADQTAVEKSAGANEDTQDIDTGAGDQGQEPEELDGDREDEPGDESLEGKEASTKKEKPESEWTAEERAVRDQEKLLAEEPEDRDLTPLNERREWRAARLREKARITALEEENRRLRGTAASPLIPPVILTPEAVEERINKLDSDWNQGALPTWDYSRLEEEKTAIRAAAAMTRMMAETHAQNEHDRRREAIDKAIAKQEQVLPGLKKAWDFLVADPQLGHDPLIGQIIGKNIANGSGLSLAYWLGNHIKQARELMELSPDSRAVRLHEIRTKLSKAPKPAPGSGYRPERPLVNSSPYATSTSDERHKGEDDVQKQIRAHIHKVRGRY